jgi:ribosomal protein L12E/L44/L45/RPP1/RPP2
MKEQAAYSLLVLAGKKPSKADVKAFFTASGVKCDDEALDRFFT